METIKKLESLLRSRPEDWWNSLVNFIPELAELEETPQPPAYHAEGDVAIHTRMAIEACPSDCDTDLLWIALLHDIGKPATTKLHGDGRITSHGHDKLGAQLAEKILKRIGMNPERRERIVWPIKNHMFHHAWQLKQPEDLSNRQKAYLLNPNFLLLLEFIGVDAKASRGKSDKMHAYHFYKKLLQKVNSGG